MRALAIKTLAAFSALLFFSFNASAEEEKVLNVYNWSDYIGPDTLEKFTAATGIKVNYDVFGAYDEIDAKVRAGKSGYDVVFPPATPIGAQHIKAGLYRKLDKSLIPNLANLDPLVMKALSDAADPGNLYLTPYMTGAVGIGYNVDKLKALAPDAPLDSWSLVFDTAIVSQFKECGVSLLGAPGEVFASALLYKGKDGASQSSDDLKIAAEVVRSVRPDVRYFHSVRFMKHLPIGKTCVAQGYVGDLIQARDRALEADGGVNIEIFIPKEGSVMSIDAAAIPADAPHPGNAHKFINFLLQPEIIADISNIVGWANAVPASREFMEEAIIEDKAIYPDDEIRARLFQLPPATPAFEAERAATWKAVKLIK